MQSMIQHNIRRSHGFVNDSSACLMSLIILVCGIANVWPNPFGFGPAMVLNSNAKEDLSGDDYNPIIKSNGSGTWIAAWSSDTSRLYSGAPDIGSDFDILWCRSTNNGDTWTTPATLNEADSDHNSARDSSITLDTDGNGVWVVAWVIFGTNDIEYGGDHDILISRSTDDGISWSTEKLLLEDMYTDTARDYGPCIATDRNGIWIIGWSPDNRGEVDGLIPTMYFSRSEDNGLTWSNAIPLGIEGLGGYQSDRITDIKTDGNGVWLAAYHSKNLSIENPSHDFDVRIIKSLDNGFSWSAPHILNINPYGDRVDDAGAKIECDGSGNWICVWDAEDEINGNPVSDRDTLYSVSTDSGDSWSEAQNLIPYNKGKFEDSIYAIPSIATDGNGIWFVTSQGAVSISSNLGNHWSPFTSFTPATSSIPAIQIESDQNGGWMGVWSTDSEIEESINDDYDIVFSYNPEFQTPPVLIGSKGTVLDETSTTVTFTPNYTESTPSREILSFYNYTDTPLEVTGITLDSPYLIGNPLTSIIQPGEFDELAIDLQTTNGGAFDESLVISFNHHILTSKTLNLSGRLIERNPFGFSDKIQLTSQPSGSIPARGWDPSVHGDDSGNWVMAWSYGDGISISRSNNNGITWSDVNTLDSMGVFHIDFNYNPDIATDGQGNWIVTWEAEDIFPFGAYGINDNDIYYAISNDNGYNWSGVSFLNSHAGIDSRDSNDFNVQLEVNETGTWIAVWETRENIRDGINEDHAIVYARSFDKGANWTRAAQLTTATLVENDPLTDIFGTQGPTEFSPQIAVGSDGIWVSTWASLETYVSRSIDDGSIWSEAILVSEFDEEDNRICESPSIATDRNGNWVLAWVNIDLESSWFGPQKTNHDIYISYSNDNALTWSSPALVNLETPTSFKGYFEDINPNVVCDFTGNWFVFWESNENLNNTIGTDRDLFIAHSADNGKTWNSPYILNSDSIDDGLSDRDLEIDSDAHGTIIGVWEHLHYSTNLNLYRNLTDKTGFQIK
jgi:hypothetical protein